LSGVGGGWDGVERTVLIEIPNFTIQIQYRV
jgi:hypothetical protein